MLQFQLTADLDAVSATAMWDVWISADPAAGQAVLERGVPVRVLALAPVLLHRRAPYSGSLRPSSRSLDPKPSQNMPDQA